MGSRPSRQPYTMAEVSRPTRDGWIDRSPHGLEHPKHPFPACVYPDFEAIEFVKHLIEDEAKGGATIILVFLEGRQEKGPS